MIHGDTKSGQIIMKFLFVGYSYPVLLFLDGRIHPKSRQAKIWKLKVKVITQRNLALHNFYTEVHLILKIYIKQ